MVETTLNSGCSRSHLLPIRLFEETVVRPMGLSKMEVHSTIYDSKILNLWKTEPCFEMIHGLLVSVFNKVYKQKVSRFTAQYSSCNLKSASF